MSESGSCLKVLWLWGSPSLVVPLLMALTLKVWPVGVVISISFLVIMGQSLMEEPDSRTGEKTNRFTGQVLLYVVLQIIWIPLFLFGVLWGICAMSGGTRF